MHFKVLFAITTTFICVSSTDDTFESDVQRPFKVYKLLGLNEEVIDDWTVLAEDDNLFSDQEFLKHVGVTDEDLASHKIVASDVRFEVRGPGSVVDGDIVTISCHMHPAAGVENVYPPAFLGIQITNTGGEEFPLPPDVQPGDFIGMSVADSEGRPISLRLPQIVVSGSKASVELETRKSYKSLVSKCGLVSNSTLRTVIESDELQTSIKCRTINILI